MITTWFYNLFIHPKCICIFKRIYAINLTFLLQTQQHAKFGWNRSFLGFSFCVVAILVNIAFHSTQYNSNDLTSTLNYFKINWKVHVKHFVCLWRCFAWRIVPNRTLVTRAKLSMMIHAIYSNVFIFMNKSNDQQRNRHFNSIQFNWKQIAMTSKWQRTFCVSAFDFPSPSECVSIKIQTWTNFNSFLLKIGSFFCCLIEMSYTIKYNNGIDLWIL